MLYKNIETVTPKMIKVLIDDSSYRHRKIKKLYERYKGDKDGVPILTRKYTIEGKEQTDKINNKLANDFFGEIIDMKVGFFCGVPIVYELEKNAYMAEQINPDTQEPEEIISTAYDTDIEFIKTWGKINQIADLDLETVKRASICGYCGRLLYIGQNGDEPVVMMMLVEPWELIFIGDSIETPREVIRYYQVCEYKENGDKILKDWAELYKKDIIEVYLKNSEGDYILQETKDHSFSNVPLFGFANNDELLGDAEKVLTLIDAYDRTASDVDSELEQFRLAYLKFVNCSISGEALKEARQTGAFSLPGEDADVGFITKSLDDNIIEHHSDRLERNIYRFSKTPNMNDSSFSGDITGIAMKFKFRSFEDKCKVTELKFEKASNQEFKLLADIWNQRGASIDYLDVELQFTRNYPQNIPEEIQMLRDSKGIISEETRFSLVSFIENPQDEMKKLEAEEQENLDNFIERNERLGATSDEEDTNAYSNKAADVQE